MPRRIDAGKPTSVYLIQIGPLVKIGLSVDVSKRLTSLSAGMVEAPDAVFYREFSFNQQAFAAERRMHRHFRGQRVRGEWFRIAIADAVTVLDEMPVPRWSDIRHDGWKGPTGEESEEAVRQAMLRGREAAIDAHRLTPLSRRWGMGEDQRVSPFGARLLNAADPARSSIERLRELGHRVEKMDISGLYRVNGGPEITRNHLWQIASAAR